MANHVHEWIPWKGEPWFFTCKDENCPRVLDKLETTERVNATERLSAKQAIRLREMFYPVVYDNEPDALSLVKSLNAYADTLEGKC